MCVWRGGGGRWGGKEQFGVAGIQGMKQELARNKAEEVNGKYVWVFPLSLGWSPSSLHTWSFISLTSEIPHCFLHPSLQSRWTMCCSVHGLDCCAFYVFAEKYYHLRCSFPPVLRYSPSRYNRKPLFLWTLNAHTKAMSFLSRCSETSICTSKACLLSSLCYGHVLCRMFTLCPPLWPHFWPLYPLRTSDSFCSWQLLTPTSRPWHTGVLSIQNLQTFFTWLHSDLPLREASPNSFPVSITIMLPLYSFLYMINEYLFFKNFSFARM